MATENAEHLIEIRVDRLAQLFHTLDPFPFWEKDLDQEAEEYIVGWARELPDMRPLRIAVHIPDRDVLDAHSKELNEAFHRYFAGRAVAVQHELNELFRVGRRSLAIGNPILVACFILARLAAGKLSANPGQRRVEDRWRSSSTTGGHWRAGATCTGVWRRLQWSSGRMRSTSPTAQSAVARGSRLVQTAPGLPEIEYPEFA